MRPGHLRVATRWFAKYGNWIIFIARLTPGTRLIVYISAGVRGSLYEVRLTLPPTRASSPVEAGRRSATTRKP